MALDFYLRSAPDPDPDDGRLYDGTGPAAGLQAARFDAAADTLTMPTAALPSGSGAWTVATWGVIDVDRNGVTTFWSLDGVFSSSWHSLRTSADGTSLKLNESGTDVVSIASLTVGTWYFLVVRKDAAGAIKAYVGTEAGGALSTVTGAVSNIATYSGDGYVGGNAYGDFLNGRMWGLRLWDAELSDAEVDAEFAAATAARTSNLRAQWLLDAVPPTADTSGNSRTLTNTGGAWALEAGPVLPAGSGITVDVGRALATATTYAPTAAKAGDVGRALTTTLARAPTIAKTEDVGRALTTSLARAPTAAKAVDVGRATATASTFAPSPLKTEDVGRALATASTYTPEVRPAIVLVGRATATATAYAPTVSKTEDVGRSLATSTARAPTVGKSTAVGRALAGATTYTPTVDAGIPEVFVDVGSRALAVATGRTPSVDAVLGVARVTVRAIRPLDVITNTERRGSAGWRSWRRA